MKILLLPQKANMKKFVYSISLLVALISSSAIGQEKMLTMEDAIIGQWRNLYPKSIYGQWQPQTHNLTYNKEAKWHLFNAKTGQESTMLSLGQLNNTFRDKGIDTLSRMPRLNWISESKLLIKAHNRLYAYNLDAQKITNIFAFEPGDEHLDYPNNLNKPRIAATNENSLYIITPNERITVAKSRSKDMVYGQSASRREFGISKGTFWSPKGHFLAYYIKDNTEVTDYPLVDVTSRIAEVRMTPYPMAGTESEHVSLGVYDIEKNRTVYIEDENAETEQYLTNITWGPEEKYIYIQVLNREQNHMKLNQYNVKTGELIKTLFEEKHEKYVEPYHELTFVPGKVDEFVYQTRNNGYNHLYLYDTEGKLKRQLTHGHWEVTKMLGFDAKGKHIYYVSTEVSPIERHAYKVSLRNPSNKTQITQLEGTHSVSLASDGKFLFDRFSSTDVPGISQVIDTKSLDKQVLMKAENPLVDYKLGDMEIGTIKAGDNKTDLYYRLIKPADFDPTKKYPAIIYVYGGPHAQLITNRWLGSARMWMHYMAQNGYVMLTVDNRGSANRGLEFENVIHRQLGKLEMEDQLKGVDLLKDLGFVDTARIGVHGWSYGGFMTTSLMTHHPDIFKVGVAGGPVIDWKYYEIMYGERYMDSPQENPEGYEATSLVKMAPKLEGKLLIIHGGIDPTVVQQHSLVFIRECVKNNVPVDYFEYPRAEHNVRGKDRIHLMQKVTDYFNDYLK